MEPSCRKVGAMQFLPGRDEGRSEMTATSFSRASSRCFLTLLIWAGCTAVVCLVDESIDVDPATITGYHSTGLSAIPTHGVTAAPFACGNTDRCRDICDICHALLPAPRIDCLSLLYDNLCGLEFMGAMESLNSSDWCSWDLVRGLYSKFSGCTEEMADCLLIPWPNSLVEQIFVDVHSKFFKDCPTEELSDPPEAVVFALVMTPICLIPIMVSLVVLKTKNGDGSS